jgi:parallel beta-helix repeat protein
MKIARSLFVVSFALASATFAHAQCPTSDDMTIQNAISAAAAAGGGTVQLEARIYSICQPVVLASNVHLRGRGIGATVLRTRPGWPTGPLASFGASIIGSGVANVSVVGLTLDQRTNGRMANGIAFVPANADFSGAVSRNILIERNQVIGAPIDGGHQYLIWNMRGQNVKIVHNWVDGGFVSQPSAPFEEGIESFGGYDVLVEGNTVQGIGGTCLNFGSAIGIPDTYTAGLFIRNNYAFLCNVGINLGAGDESQQTAYAIVSGNVVVYAWKAGITVLAGPGTSLRDLQITGNTIRAVGVSGASSLADGILLFGESGAKPITTIVEGNQIDLVMGTSFGIRLEFYSSVRILNNSILKTGREGIYAYSANDVEMRGNRIQGTGLRGIYTGPSVQAQIVTDNLIVDWGSGSEGIRLDGVGYGVVRNNIFRRTDAARPPAVVLGPGTCGVTLDGNVVLYAGFVNNGMSPACSW